jgi:uncharacterized protein YodC (DUF2158 family)
MIQDSPFKPGDTIRLKTGGPAMSVIGSNEFSKTVFCQWFAGDELQKGEFPFTSVEPAPLSPQTGATSSVASPPTPTVSASPKSAWPVVHLISGIAIIALTIFLVLHDLAASKPFGAIVIESVIGLGCGIALTYKGARGEE